ncbi:MAG: isoprenylcysteine carboxylmethyltransferase family protein [Acidobacteria bacterium]|nr:isoprenylcysteine carboxylmethyltransferase family protein [Acidobacteriota bacterium]
MVFILTRAVTYAALFVSVMLVFLPARVLDLAGVSAPITIGPLQAAGMALGSAGAALAVWCVLTFALVGQGTPAPFDPPRRLVVRGPYRFVRNPMYIGAGCALIGAALFYRAPELLGYVGVLWMATHTLVVFYEERVLGRTFGHDYEEYRHQVRRWLPRL